MTDDDPEERLTKEDIRQLFTLLEQAEEEITENETDDEKVTGDKIRMRIIRIRRILTRMIND